MGWIEFHPSRIKRLKKFQDFRRTLNWSVIEGLGFLGSFWGEVIELAEDGDISGWTPEYLAELTDLKASPERVWKALVQNGWIDEIGPRKLLHDWLDYAGRYLEGRYRSSSPERLMAIWKTHGIEWGGKPGRKMPSGWWKIRKQVIERDYHTCKYCGKQDEFMEVDHIVPVSRGGTDDLSNLVASCRSCNRDKGSKPDNSLTLACPPNLTLPNQPNLTPDEAFELLWPQYPRREGKKEASRHFCASVKNYKDWQDIQNALKNYKAKLIKEKTDSQFVKMGSTWFNNWRDYVSYNGVDLPKPVVLPKPKRYCLPKANWFPRRMFQALWLLLL